MSREQEGLRVFYPKITVTFDPKTTQAYAEWSKKQMQEISDIRQKILELGNEVAELQQTLEERKKIADNNAGLDCDKQRKKEEEAKREMHMLLAFNTMNVFC